MANDPSARWRGHALRIRTDEAAQGERLRHDSELRSNHRARSLLPTGPPRARRRGAVRLDGEGGLRVGEKWSRLVFLPVPVDTHLYPRIPCATSCRSSQWTARQSLRAGDGYGLLISRLKVRFLRGAPTHLSPPPSRLSLQF